MKTNLFIEHLRMTDDTWQDLYGKWKDSLNERAGEDPQQPGHWFSIWRMIIGHPWFQQELHDCTGFEVRGSNLPDDLADDVEQEVILLLAGKLSRRRDLGMDVELAEETFPAFMGTIIRNGCRQVARQLRRQFVRTRSLLSPHRVLDHSTEIESFADLNLEIDELDDPQRTIVLLSLKGMTLKEIAEQIRMSYKRVCREYNHGRRRLAKTL
jgi:RNA polymerase sigma factor (sigma-70 family)